LVPVKQRTWGQFRGYATVDVIGGAADVPVRSQTRYRYFRSATGTHSVSVDGIKDADHLNGFVREELTYDRSGGTPLSATLTTPWLSAPTASGADGTTARFVRPGTTQTRVATAAAPGGWRTTQTTTTFESTYGQPTQVEELGDLATPADDRCTRIEYTRNTTAHILTSVRRQETVAVACGKAPSRPGDVISDVRTYFDGNTSLTAVPTVGLPTRVERVASYSNGVPTYITEATTSYDVHGRVVAVTDALNRTTTTTYTPATGGPVTATRTTTPDPDDAGPLTAHETLIQVDPARALPVRVADPNGKVTSATYDPLGRLTAVWLPGRAQGSATANTTFAYRISTTGTNAITTRTLGHTSTYLTSVQLFDGLLRPRQTQTQTQTLGTGGTPAAARLVTDTLYDTRGQVSSTHGGWVTTGAPATTLVRPTQAVPARTEIRYDGVGRPIAEIFEKFEKEAWRTTTAYDGDRVTVHPPRGAVAETRITDALGRLVELRQHTGGGRRPGLSTRRPTPTTRPGTWPP
jgi:YD repeat-containing protein